ncbi:hypothetical protein Vadar_023524 [Vaccinium darrowii]|uniref:Uncharacterized protein n=1 Tax=Vaccinium darrowii TaxID=229202 RepID=A0ACB7Y8U6_9ERIC|nr:hypothetical protein Vadar_023524 [Vaccinium darrowii]
MPKISNPFKLATTHHRLVLTFQAKPISTTPVPTHDHITHLILEQKTATQALQTFRWASNLPNFAHSQSTYRALIHKLCSFRRFDTVHQVLDEMPSSIGSPPDEDIYVTLVRGLGRAKMIRNVIKVLDLVSKFDETPSLKIYNSILDVLVKEDIDLARKFYREKMMESGVEGDDYTFGILMKGLCLTNRIDEGFKHLAAMKSRGLTPNTVIYNTLLHGICKNGKVGRARSLMNEMLKPNEVTFNILISAYCREGNVVQALVMLEKSFSNGCVPDVITVTKVIDILCNEGHVAEAVEVLERVKSNGEMKRAGISWNFVTFDTLIYGLCSGGKTNDGFKILELMEESKRGSGGRISPYNNIIYGLYKENRLNEAFEFFTKMGKLFPRAIKRSSGILGLCKECSMEDAKRVYNQMTEEGGIPSALVYSSLIHGFCQKGFIKEAFELMNTMISRGYFPVASTFNSVIIGLCKDGKIGSAMKLLEDLVGRGCLPNIESYNPLVEALCRNGEFKKALLLFLQMVDKGIVPDFCTWNSLVLCIFQEKMWIEGKSMFLERNLLE